jgi:hypothetical protein
MDQALKDALTEILGARAVFVLTQFGVGVGLLYIIDKFFKLIEEKLADDTKLEIAVWLLGIKTADHVPWPKTFARVFDRVFGKRMLSWVSLTRSFGLTVLVVFGWQVFGYIQFVGMLPVRLLFLTAAVNLLPDYLSLFIVKTCLARLSSSKRRFLKLVLVLVPPTVGVFLAGLCLMIVVSIYGTPGGPYDYDAVFAGYASLTTSLIGTVWLWLYAGSGFLLKAAHHFDVGFEWFNRRFDIEKKPLQSIGLVAGSLVALTYWSAVVVSGMVK